MVKQCEDMPRARRSVLQGRGMLWRSRDRWHGRLGVVRCAVEEGRRLAALVCCEPWPHWLVFAQEAVSGWGGPQVEAATLAAASWPEGSVTAQARDQAAVRPEIPQKLWARLFVSSSERVTAPHELQLPRACEFCASLRREPEPIATNGCATSGWPAVWELASSCVSGRGLSVIAAILESCSLLWVSGLPPSRWPGSSERAGGLLAKENSHCGLGQCRCSYQGRRHCRARGRHSGRL